ncbi:ATP synthase subunit 5 [Viridothelium virens]|uniref:ATP synthase subunit 5, mitochondrial n=1 Tax=Viridothelium virens TaxID=1048519 RepID=A0A6A6GVW5_VIRVR|nr:ATP synthase subunit 5 [Viridothelium virens]
MLSRRALAQATRASGRRTPIGACSAIRSYATPAAGAPSTKPPVPLFGLDGTYASALYTAAAKSSSLDNTANAIQNMLQVFKRDERLQRVVSAPTLSAEDKKQIVSELQKQIGGADKSDTVKNLLTTLADNNRLSILEGVCEKFGTLISAYRGEVECTITSAAPLDPKVLRQLENTIAKSQYVGQGKKLKVVPKVNSDIKGGLVVEIGDRTIDDSVSAKMARMNKLLRDTL